MVLEKRVLISSVEAGVSMKHPNNIAETTINDGTLTFDPEEMDLNDALNVLNDAYN